MPEESKKYDDILWTIATQSGGVPEFLNVIANFLKRRTDFFTGTTNDQWEKLLINIFQQISKANETPAQKDSEKLNTQNPKPVINVSIKSDAMIQNGKTSPKQSPRKSATKSPYEVEEEQEEDEISKPIEIANDETESDDVGKLIPNAGNGCTLTNYSWTQTLDEIELKIPLRVAQPLRSRDVNVNITKKSIVVGLKGQRPIIDGELYEEIRPDESTWMLQDGMVVCITLEKKKKKVHWWERLIMSDPVIAIRRIDPELSKLSDLDGNSRATVEKMLYDQRRKQMGLPTNEEDKQKMQVLERFQKSHPELDFSRCKF